MKQHLLLATLATLLLAACSNTTLIDEERTFQNNIWNRLTPEVFELNVKNADNYYNIDFTLTFDTALIRNDRMPLIIDIHSNDGTHRQLVPKITLRENGRWKGQPDGPYRTVTARTFNFFTFNNPGTHSYQIKQGTSQYHLEGIHALRLTITQAKLDYDNL